MKNITLLDIAKMSFDFEELKEEAFDIVFVILVTLIIVCAWLSTNSRPRRHRTIFVMGRPHRRHNIVPTNTPQSEAENTLEMSQVDEDDTILIADNTNANIYSRDEVEPSETESAEEVEQESESDNAQVREMDSIVNAMEADRCRDCQLLNRARDSQTNSANSESASPPNAATNNDDNNKINIKLKYLNDTSRDVVGNLNELLKDFKLRYFSTELTARHTVKLIFKGRLLTDNLTLAECGVHDHAVIHCLVHSFRQSRTQQPVVSEEPSRTVIQHEVIREVNGERVWDLENVLMTLVSVALTVVWFLRCEYSSMFTASASVALFGLTVFYGVAIFGLYISDTLQFHPRPRAREFIPDN